MRIKEFMHSPVTSISENETVSKAAYLMKNEDIGALVVTDGADKLCGILTDRDIVLRCVGGGKEMEQTSVGDVMTRQVVSIPPEMRADDAVELMSSRQIRRLPVVENGSPVGMVSLSDLARRRMLMFEASKALTEITRP